MAIKLLTDELINHIAAGEVIERPSAVIKELIENSIDSKAEKIEISIENSGLSKIIVKDNGSGIEKEDLLNAPIRHATSKISSFNDLYSINTMGFRGEALASIFSISKAKIITKNNSDDSAYEISSDNLKSIKKSGHSEGTSVIVENLFYNTPARRKYLKSENLELKEIVDVVKRFCLIHYDKQFILSHNNKVLLNKPQFRNSKENIIYILGRDLKDSLCEVDYQNKGIKIKGFLANPSEITTSFKKHQFTFVNSRFVKSKIINNAIYDGFSTNLMEGRHPLFIIFIEIDPEIIDVNVHPTKIEIKFENELEIYETVRLAVKKVFEKETLFKPVKESRDKDYSLPQVTDILPEKRKISKEEKTYYSSDKQTELNTQRSFSFQEPKKEVQEKIVLEKEIKYGPLYDVLKEYRIVGQVNKTFIILETPKEMIVVDQHVAEEKFYFENFKKNLISKKPISQTLLKSEVINLSLDEMILFKEYKELLESLGFVLEEFGQSEILVRAVPYGLKGELLNPQVVKDIIHEVKVDKKFLKLEDKLKTGYGEVFGTQKTILYTCRAVDVCLT